MAGRPWWEDAGYASEWGYWHFRFTDRRNGVYLSDERLIDLIARFGAPARERLELLAGCGMWPHYSAALVRIRPRIDPATVGLPLFQGVPSCP